MTSRPTPAPEGGPKGPDAARLETVRGVKSALDALRLQIELKPDAEAETVKETRLRTSVQALLTQYRKAREAHKDSPQNQLWATIERELTNGVELKDANELVTSLIDPAAGVTADLATLSTEMLGTEISSVDKYLEEFGSTDGKIWNRIGQLLASDRLGSRVQEQLKTLGMTMEDLQGMVASFFAGLIERIGSMAPNLLQISGGLRFRAALLAAAKDDRLKDDPEYKALLADPKEMNAMRKKWQELYRGWVQQKSKAEKANPPVPFEQPAPDIYMVLHPPKVEPPKAPDVVVPPTPTPTPTPTPIPTPIPTPPSPTA